MGVGLGIEEQADVSPRCRGNGRESEKYKEDFQTKPHVLIRPARVMHLRTPYWS
jgi:hypothetical protein